ncbi:methyltransferase [Tenggerimyces flavus]|uniref:Methyltransferase n=1 Tax=Tenggerimyces flavus TaxID=1708749 RepID=A0ABV7YN19_9ACTN|nr:methyltransferase [Tenggerimyces flavus]MBM7790464.1 16S rRNA G1207 methylase RsmC [Tenggerimyces flavus]
MTQRWLIGLPTSTAEVPPGTSRIVALSASELRYASENAMSGVFFHEAMKPQFSGDAETVDIYLPTYRGKSFVSVLAWLAAARLATSTCEIRWHLDKQQGPDSIQKLLAADGWSLTRQKKGRVTTLTGTAPAAPALPDPTTFDAALGSQQVQLAADYGVFSPRQVDAGTQLLLDVALAHRPVPAVADIGIGYGALALGLVLNGVATRAVGSDIDAVALWLAERNAQASNVELRTECDADPTAPEDTPLTVCNIPTHINAQDSRQLMAGLLQRAKQGRLLVVVHSSLEARYAKYFDQEGLEVERTAGEAHTVLAAGQTSS